jgi:Ran GTPase-activating protein (RanGAP) involved in mRNA processing and transport
MVLSNIVLRELDLSLNGITSSAGIMIFIALLDNYSIKKISMRGNLLDDEVAYSLYDLLAFNDVIEEIDLGKNKLGYECCNSISKAMGDNHALKVLYLDGNRLGDAGTASIKLFTHAFIKNCYLRTLQFDDNKLSSEWGFAIAYIIACNRTLVKVSLQNNRLNAVVGAKLLDAYEHNLYLEELSLSGEEIGLEMFRRLQKIFNDKRAIAVPYNDKSFDETNISNDDLSFLTKYEPNSLN